MNAAQKAEVRVADDKLVLTEGQVAARLEIRKAAKPKKRHLLSGSAGTGKTTLVGLVVADFLKAKKKVSVCAPTHKAVAVLATKLSAAGVSAPCTTIHSLLSLEPQIDTSGKQVFRRRKRADPVDADVVVVDECSMLDASLVGHIERHLHHCFVLYVGDPAQLPPVNEPDSATFATPSRSHLTEIVRQESDNPILVAAQAIRDTQDHDDMEWDWCKSAKVPPKGVYLPGKAIDLWMQKAFMSAEFKRDNDRFRYLCWRNAKVHAINAKIRRWLYGDTEFPLNPGEKALIRAPIIKDKTIALATNEEAYVLSIEAGTHNQVFPRRFTAPRWSVEIPVWKMTLVRDDHSEVDVMMPIDDALIEDVNARLVAEAKGDHERWRDFYDFRGEMAKLQAVYCLTIHNSQGSTFGTIFLDVADIRGRGRSDLSEMKRLLYTGATRPSESLILVGV